MLAIDSGGHHYRLGPSRRTAGGSEPIIVPGYQLTIDRCICLLALSFDPMTVASLPLVERIVSRVMNTVD